MVCQKRFHNYIKKIVVVVPLAVQNSFVFRGVRLEIAGHVRIVRIQSVRFVNLLVADVHFNLGKKWLQNVVYMINETNWNLLLLVGRFLIRFCLYFVLFLSFWHFKFRNHEFLQIPVSKPNKFVSKQHSGSDWFQIQTLCSFQQVM